nr:hypothetical protein [Tanacetum cinerariifolium]
IPGPEAPPSPDYIPEPEAPSSPDYIPGPDKEEEEEHLAPTVPTPALHSSISASEDSDQTEPFEEGETANFSVLLDGDDLSEDDVDDEDDKESSDSKEEEEEHLAPTVPTPALHSSISASEDSDQTKPFEEGETAVTPPPFGYHVAARISVQPHIFMPFYSGEGIPKANVPLRKRARFTTPTGGYEVGESSVAGATRQIRLALTVADSRRVKDRLIGRLRREAIFSHLVYHICEGVTQIEALQMDVSTLQRQQIDDEYRLTRHIQHEHAQRDASLEDGDSCS